MADMLARFRYDETIHFPQKKKLYGMFFRIEVMTVAVLKDVSSRPSRQSEEAFNMLLSQAQERAMRWEKYSKPLIFQKIN